ncbi:MAG: hypothetical protein JOZ93_19670 [Sinobacteraceae bacterium]|nr:hypothetical protein [Nevskiaceae bacterium]
MNTLLVSALSTLVFCAPGYPGGAGDAQPYLDQFAKEAVAAAGWPAGGLAAIYDPTEEGGLAKLQQADAVLAFVPYPFFVEHGAQLHLTPLAQADVAGTGTQQKWTLVAKPGRVTSPASLGGFTILSSAGYAPQFVRHSALQSWPVPADVKIVLNGQTLSALRRVANGEPVAVLLDQTQTEALPTLPFAADVKAVTVSPPLPVAIVAVVNNRVPAAQARTFQAGLLKLGHAEGNKEALGSLRLNGFVMPQLPQQPPAHGDTPHHAPPSGSK